MLFARLFVRKIIETMVRQDEIFTEVRTICPIPWIAEMDAALNDARIAITRALRHGLIMTGQATEGAGWFDRFLQ